MQCGACVIGLIPCICNLLYTTNIIWFLNKGYLGKINKNNRACLIYVRPDIIFIHIVDVHNVNDIPH